MILFKGFKNKFSGLFNGGTGEEIRGSEFAQNMYEALLESDASLEATEKIIATLSKKIGEPKKKYSYIDLKKILNDTLIEILNGVKADTWGMLQGERPFKIFFWE